MIDVRPLCGALGAEVFGIDLSRRFDDEVLAAIKQALRQYLVLFVHGQHLTPSQQLTVSAAFGTPRRHDYISGLADAPEVVPIRKERTQAHNFGGTWHTDMTYLDRPPIATVLHARIVPDCGGDTLWSNQYLAYETLSDGMKILLAPLTAIHSSLPAYGGVTPDAPPLMAEHPLIGCHPDTQRKFLYVNPVSVDSVKGMTHEESRGLLCYLFQHARSEVFTCRYRWRENDVAIWDNRCTLHMALNDYPGKERLMHRVSVV